MRNLPPGFVMIAAILWSACAGAELPASVDSKEVPHYQLLAPGLATAGQPSPEFLARTRELGFKTVINLRTLEEGPAAEAETIKGLGLHYVSVPVTASSFSLAAVEAVRQVLDDASAGPVLLHCTSANRVGAVIGVIGVQKGMSLEAAETEARRIGLSSDAMTEAFRRVAGQVTAVRPVASPSPAAAATRPESPR